MSDDSPGAAPLVEEVDAHGIVSLVEVEEDERVHETQVNETEEAKKSEVDKDGRRKAPFVKRRAKKKKKVKRSKYLYQKETLLEAKTRGFSWSVGFFTGGNRLHQLRER